MFIIFSINLFFKKQFSLKSEYVAIFVWSEFLLQQRKIILSGFWKQDRYQRGSATVLETGAYIFCRNQVLTRLISTCPVCRRSHCTGDLNMNPCATPAFLFLWRLQQYVFGPRWTWEAEINVRRRLKIDKGSKVAVSLAIRASCFLKHSRSPGWRCALHCRELCGEMPSLNLSSPLGKERHQLVVLPQH